MKIEIKLKNINRCTGCPCNALNSQEESICSLGYWDDEWEISVWKHRETGIIINNSIYCFICENSNSIYSDYIDDGVLRPIKCIEDNGE